MTWNHRVVRHKAPRPGATPYLAIHEVYYDRKGRLNGVTENTIAPMGDTLDELRTELARMLAATGQPVLDYDKDFRPSKKRRK